VIEPGPPSSGRVPTPRRSLVRRDRLTDRLVLPMTVRPRLLLVSAPAGFGKTTLMSQWLTAEEARGSRVVWLSLERHDSDLLRFLTRLVSVLAARIDGFGAGAQALLDASATPSIEVVVGDMLTELDELEEPTVLALDDYHVVDAPAVHEAVTFLLENLPPRCMLAIATRADPALPVARLRGRGELLEIRADDLRFTTDEAGAFLHDVMGLELEGEQVATLDARTEGWAAGLQLAALSLRGHDDPGPLVQAFAGSHRFILDYLVDEVLAGQRAEVSRFLLDTSVLHRLSGELCDALTGRTNGRQLLEELERENVFVVPLDEQRRWYRYHHLFADALRARLLYEQPERVRALHQAASAWFAGNGDLDDAITHALVADADAAADLIELAIPSLRNRRRDRTLRTWLNELPDDVIRGRAMLAALQGWARMSEGDLVGAEGWLAAADRALEIGPAALMHVPDALAEAALARDQELRKLPSTLALYRTAMAQATGDVEATIAQARRALELAAPDDYLSRGGAAGFLGLAAWAAGDLSTAVDTFTDAASSLHAAGNLTDELGMTVVLACMWLGRGQPTEAQRLHEHSLAVADRQPDVSATVVGDLHVGLADVLREQGDLDAAAAHMQIARELGDAASLPENRFRWYTAMAGLLRARDDLAGAVTMLDEAERRHLPGFFPDVRPIAAARARVHIAQGQLAEASMWAKRRQLAVSNPPAYLAEFDQLTLARLLIAQARTDHASVGEEGESSRASLDDVHTLLTRVVAEAELHGRGGSLVEARLVHALAYDAAGAPDAAMTELAAALAAGVPAGWIRIFLDEGQPMERLLQEATARADCGRHARLLLVRAAANHQVADELPRSAGPTHGVTPADEELSEREVEVVRLMATDLSGPEIARQLFVSINTLRTHSKHIFTKLGVNTRRAAVRRAAELELL
jgi:LuxR family transcriptional regulator, maltose regulon positive regulatory protein